MNKIREIIRLAEANVNKSRISRALNISRPVINQYLVDLKKAGLTYATIKALSDILRVINNTTTC